LNFLPPDPLYGLLLVIYKDYLKKIGFSFVQDLTYKSIGPADYKSAFLESFMKEVKEERHFAGDVFYTEGEVENYTPNNHCVYFFTSDHYKQSVVLGVGNHVKISLDAYESEYLVIEEKGAFELYRPETVFGTVEFLNGQERSHWAICLQNCLLFKISRTSFLENYHLLTLEEKESVALSVEKYPTKKCLICKEEHFFLSCPYTFAISKVLL
jgi:CRP-like cAMP-binding protein